MAVERVWFIPGKGRDGEDLKVPVNPISDPGVYFPKEGDWAINDQYLQRRINSGEGTISSEQPAQKVAEPSDAVKEPMTADGTAGQPAADLGTQMRTATDNFRRSRRT